MEKKDSIILGLLIIRKWEVFSNEYDFCKLLSWQFEIIYCSDLIKALTDNQFITVIKHNGNRQFILSEKGLVYLNRNKEMFFFKYGDQYKGNYYFDQLTD